VRDGICEEIVNEIYEKIREEIENALS